MAQVKRFTLPGAFAAGTDVFVAGAGFFRGGVLDIAADDTSALAAVRAAAPGAVESGPLDDTTSSQQPGSSRDPYPEYLKQNELVASIEEGTDSVALALKTASVAAVEDAIGTGALTTGGTTVTVDGIFVPTLDIDSAPPALPSCRVRADNVGQTCPNEFSEYIKFNATEVNDDSDIFAVESTASLGGAGSSPCAIKVLRPGKYLAEWVVTYEGGGAGYRSAALMIDNDIARDSGSSATEGGWVVAAGTILISLSAGQKVAVFGYVEVGAGAATTVLSAGSFQTGLALTHMGG